MYSRQDGFYNICITGRDTTSVKTSTIVLSGISSFLSNVLLSSPSSNQLIFPDFDINDIGNFLELSFTGR